MDLGALTTFKTNHFFCFTYLIYLMSCCQEQWDFTWFNHMKIPCLSVGDVWLVGNRKRVFLADDTPCPEISCPRMTSKPSKWVISHIYIYIYYIISYIYIYYNLWLLRRWIFSRLEPSQSTSFWWKNTFLIEVGDGLSLGSSMSRNPGKSIYHPSAERHADVPSSIRAICVSGRNKTRAKLMRCCWPKDLDLLRLRVKQGIFVYLPNNQGYLSW